MADLSVRDPTAEGGFRGQENDLMAEVAKDDMGGGGSIASPADYMKILKSMLSKDGAFLKATNVETVFTPQLDGAGQEALNTRLQDPGVNATMGALPAGVELVLRRSNDR